MSIPHSTIYLLSDIPLNSTYEHTFYFDNVWDQRDYFLGKTVKRLNNYSYLRKERVIKIAGDIVNARSWSYLIYENADGKWFYNFINKVEYLNDNTVELHIELDVIQTYMFDWELHQCFIERTHTRTDKIGEHTVPEGLETGPLVELLYGGNYYNFSNLCIMVLTAVDKDGFNSRGTSYNGIYSGLTIYAVDRDKETSFNTWLREMETAGKIDGIVSIWMYPKELVRLKGSWTDGDILHEVTGWTDLVDFDVGDVDSVDGYTPLNNKLFTYPYSFLYASNNMGGSAVYRRELFEKTSDGKFRFTLMGAYSPDSGVSLVPRQYAENVGLSVEHALTMPPFPTCAWTGDAYKIWLAQNQSSRELSLQQAKINGAVGIVTAGAGVAGALMGAGGIGLGTAAGGLATTYNAYKQIQGIMAQQEDMDVQPPQARGNHSANINLANRFHGFYVYHKSVSGRYALMIDEYFTRYGYKVNTIERPSLKNRKKYTYIKTVGCTVSGPFCGEDQVRIQNIFDKGITFWADHQNFCSYTLNELID